MNRELVVKSLQVLEQGINLATSKGAFQNAKDVSSLVSALEVLANYVKVRGFEVEAEVMVKDIAIEKKEKPESKSKAKAKA
jgi:hypothetical protein